MNPPSVGARMGATPITSICCDIIRAAALPLVKSLTTARGITIPADAPKAATTRQVAITARLGASAQPIVASTYKPNPASNGPRRPNRSDKEPCTTCPIARPNSHDAKVICDDPGGAAKLASIAGKPGRYMSVDSGPTAVRYPNSNGSQAGTGFKEAVFF